MAVSYEKLWKILKEMEISKTEFRKLVNISTVTLAKLSKNEMVSMAAMESICAALRRPIGEIMEFLPEQRQQEWERIDEEKVYLVKLFYITDERAENIAAEFLYGYSIAADEGVKEKARWELSVCLKKDEMRIWEIISSICGSNLLKLIQFMDQKKSIKEFLEECHAQLHHDIRNNRKEEWETLFLKMPIICCNKIHRPEILLLPERESAVLAKEMQPIHAFGEVPLFSESFVCMSKQKLYCDTDGSYNMEKMELIYDFFRQESYLINGVKDLMRIGDFEVFHAPSGCFEPEELLCIESLTETLENRKLILKGFKITVLALHLSGSYVLEVVTYNADNPTSCKIYDITVDGEDVARTVELPESSERIEVRLWEKAEEKKIQLAAYQNLSFIREIITSFHINERNITLEDAYTRKYKKTYGNSKEKTNNIDRSIKWYESMESRMEDFGNDPWRKEFEKVERDFLQLYGKEMAESRFFAQGMEAHEEFLKWLKQQINSKEIKSVWIFDPYIDADSVPRILRSLANMSVKIHVVTDAKAPSRNAPDRIEKVEKSCRAMGEFLKDKLMFYAFDENRCLLHDRMLILFGNQYIPSVYNMSNSLDNMGMYEPSVVCKLSRDTAKRAAEYYLDLFWREQNQGKVQTLWEYGNQRTEFHGGVSSAQQADLKQQEKVSEQEESALEEQEKVQRNQRVSKEQKEQSAEKQIEQYLAELSEFFNQKLEAEHFSLLKVENSRIIMPDFQNQDSEKTYFFQVLCSDMPDCWDKIAYLCANIEYSKRAAIKDYLKENYKPEWGDTLRKITEEGLDQKEGSAEGISGQDKKEMLFVYEKENFADTLKSMGYLLENPYYIWRERELMPPGKMALEMLIEKDFDQYKEMVLLLEKKIKTGSWSALKKKQYLIYQIAYIIAEDKKNARELAEKCLVSENNSLIALGMEWFIQRRELKSVLSVVQDNQFRHEFFKAMVIDLQVEDCRKKYRSAKENVEQQKEWEEKKEIFLKKLREVKEEWVRNFSEKLTAKQLQEAGYFKEIATRSNEDVCEIIVMLFHAGKLSPEEFENFLIFCLFEKAEKVYSLEQGVDSYWREKDFEDGKMFLKAMHEFGTLTSGKKALRTLTLWEKKLVDALHDVFLQRRNYTKWKSYIDTLLWCCTMRGIIQKLWSEYNGWAAEDKNLQTRQKEIKGLLKKYHITLEEYSEAYRLWQRLSN